MDYKIRDADEADFDALVLLNAREQRQTSPMDSQRLQLLHDLASYHRVVQIDRQVSGFILAMRDTACYQNDNFSWFASRYEQFLYIDRIVVAERFAGRKIGSALYADLFAYCRGKGIQSVVCEYNIQPPNPGSRAFHAKFGFREVGTQCLAVGKQVSMQMLDLSRA
jgi:hypothetical protein